jgi:c-di-GMP-binding flagellar brake protein YcgR
MMKKYGDVEFERRVFPRFIIHLPFSYEVENKKNEGITNNVSQGGVQVYLPEPVALHTVLNFKFALPEDNETQYIDATAKVIWIQRSVLPAPKKYKAGLVFIDISREGRKFLQWFEQLWLNQAG